MDLQGLADTAFECILKNTGESFAHDTVQAAFDSFNSIVATKGVDWLIDAATGSGMGELGWKCWMSEARERLEKLNSLNEIMDDAKNVQREKWIVGHLNSVGGPESVQYDIACLAEAMRGLNDKLNQLLGARYTEEETGSDKIDWSET